MTGEFSFILKGAGLHNLGPEGLSKVRACPQLMEMKQNFRASLKNLPELPLSICAPLTAIPAAAQFIFPHHHVFPLLPCSAFF